MSGDLMQLRVECNGVNYLVIINKNATIADLHLRAANIVFNDVLTTSDFYLTWGGIPLDSGSKTIGQHNIPDKSELGLFLRLNGGPSYSLEPLPGYITTTSSEPCSISCDDNPCEKRAKMPCDCVISVESMTHYFNNQLTMGNFRFFCPNCKAKEWDYFLVRHVLSAVKTEDEVKEIDAAVNKNFMKSPDMQKCPFCNSNCKRDKTKRFQNINRVVCPLCSKRSGREVEFCWCCLESWRGDMESCGNDGCDGTDPRCRYLADCLTKTIDGNIENVPIVRGCVKCGNLISHNTGCKHMTCRCGYIFCFVCLKPYNTISERWECTEPDAYSKCPLAPRQKHLYETFGSNGASIPQNSSAASIPQDSSAASLPQDSSAASIPQNSSAVSIPQNSSTASIPQNSSAASTPQNSRAASIPQNSSTTTERSPISQSNSDVSRCIII